MSGRLRAESHLAVYTWSCILLTYKSKLLALTSSIILTYFGTEQLPLRSNVPLSNLWGSLLSHSATPGCKETQAHRHLRSQQPPDGKINHTADECWWFMGNCDSVVITRRTVGCGMAWRLKGTKWAIIWNSTLGLRPKGGFPCLWSEGTEGKALSHIHRLWWCSCKAIASSPFVLFPLVFLFVFIFPASSWEDIFPHCDHNESGSSLCRDCVHFHRKDTQRLYGSARGGKVGGVRGSTSLRTRPLLSQLSTVVHITDKLWQMGSGKWFLHTHVISAITLVLPPRGSLCPPPHVFWEVSYQCEEVTEGNANLSWGACTLLFIFCLQWQGICSSSSSSSSVGAGARGGGVCLVTIRQRALWQCGWCAARSMLRWGSHYRPRRRGTEHGSSRIRLSTQAWEMCSWIDRPFLLRAGNTNLQMLNSWATSESAAWEISAHEIRYTIHTAEFYI